MKTNIKGYTKSGNNMHYLNQRDIYRAAIFKRLRRSIDEKDFDTNVEICLKEIGMSDVDIMLVNSSDGRAGLVLVPFLQP